MVQKYIAVSSAGTAATSPLASASIGEVLG
jgi:hypothetical protein